MMVPGQLTRAYFPPLLTVTCTLVTAQVVCYDIDDTTPHVVTPPGEWVIDFAVAPDNNWIVYRTATTVAIAAIYGGTAGTDTQQIDGQAAPPAALNPTLNTITWSPDGLAIAYITAHGLRVAFPSLSKP